jgi:simple sugar transport system ATP-binding protein
MDRNLLNSRVRDIMAAAGVAGNPRGLAGSLSGGMQQRIILAREFAEDAGVLVLAEPGWGLDRAGRERLRAELRAQVRGGPGSAGKGALLFSTDLDELLSLSDEILVLRNGEFVDHIPMGSNPSPKASRKIKEWIGRAMIGGSHE